MKELKELKIGEHFTYKDCEYPNENIVYIRGEYDKSTHKYYVYKFDDISYSTLKKGTTKVYTDFVF